MSTGACEPMNAERIAAAQAYAVRRDGRALRGQCHGCGHVIVTRSIRAMEAAQQAHVDWRLAKRKAKR